MVLTGAIDDVGAPIRATSGKSYRLGLEIDADVKLNNQFSIKSNAAFSTNKNEDFTAPIDGNLLNLGNTPLSFSPNAIVGNMLVYQPKDNFQISFLSKYVGEQFMSNLNSSVSKLDVLDSYFTSDLNFVYEIATKKVFDAIIISGLINNIFNTEYVDEQFMSNLNSSVSKLDVLDSYFTSDLNFTYEIATKKVFDAIIISGLINNIFNREYVDRGYYYTYDDSWSNPGSSTTVDGAGYYPQATRNFLVGVTLKF